MSVPNQVQKQVTTQAIAQVPQTNNAPTNNKQTAIESTPTSTPIDASNTIPAIVSNPTVSIILAFAVLVRVIVDRPSSRKK
ncbi:hypothetical protein PseudUWO311_19535 [Pseudanabaena sp. UWO311]|uniref:hypothetical protein n=1 Tax=Pseudanabaena sp. UWO311 TaxID=2487337 RepID=UPI00115B99AE|nr:hypothetical protein [Pseudanabaena sp. UWO311]TYQ24365.1 hypothetical protein PseudUWO311_19535 [Pseudanabaena sp. UWO311]